MKLISINVKNYRVHKDTTVTFDSARTVVGGPNESGKSTVAEAVHHALFLRSRVTGTVQKGMLSEIYPGHPTVVLRFESGSQTYEITKVFSGGASASTTLKELSVSGGAGAGPTLRDEAAEQKIHEILGAEDIGGRRGVENRIRSQWSHLWIWQGSATEDPLAHANADRHGQLLRERLAQVEGGGVLESALDAATAREVASRQSATFRENGKVRAGSALERTNLELEQAEDSHAGAAAALESLDAAVRTIDSSAVTIARCDEETTRHRDEMEKVRAQQRQVVELRVRIAQEESTAAAAAAAHA